MKSEAGEINSQSEDAYRSLFENATAGIGRTSLGDGTVLFANKKLAAIFGYDNLNQFIEEYKFSEHYAESDGREKTLASYDEKPTDVHEVALTDRYGSLVYVEAEVRVEKEQDYIDFVVIDVTESRRTRHELRKAEKARRKGDDLIRAMIDYSPVPLSVQDMDDNYILISPAYTRYLDVAAETAVSKKASQILPVEATERLAQADKIIKETGRPMMAKDAFPVRFGSSILQVNKFPVTNNAGKVTGICTIGVDITELEKARETLANTQIELERQVEERTRELTEEIAEHIKTEQAFKEAQRIAAVGSWRWSVTEDRLISFSEEYARIHGVGTEQIESRLAHQMEQVIHPDDREMVSRLFAVYDETGEAFEIEYRILLPSGEVRYVIEKGEPVVDDEKGKPIEQSGTIQDITEQKLTSIQIEQARQIAEKANQVKSEFLSSMSHELRTPMNAILGFAQMLGFNSRESLTERQKKYVDHILRGGNHLLELIDQVLELNKIEVGKLKLEFDNESTREVIDESLNMVKPWAVSEGIEIIDLTAEQDLPVLWTDSTRLMQVLLNLLSNAIKYNRPEGSVTLSCDRISDRLLRINVRDTGIGIPLDKQEVLFKPFERLGREAGKIEGTGIGLTITRQIVDLLGGQVGFESEENTGSLFWVDIPLSLNRERHALLPSTL